MNFIQGWFNFGVSSQSEADCNSAINNGYVPGISNGNFPNQNLTSCAGGYYQVSTYAGKAYNAGYLRSTPQTQHLYYPTAIVVDSKSNIFFFDDANHCIRKISTNGQITVFAGSASSASAFADGTSTDARFSDVYGMAIDLSENIYGKIRKVTPNGVVSTIVGTANNTPKDGDATSVQLFYPWGIAVDNRGNINFTETYSNLVRKVDSSGNVQTIFGTYC